MTLGEVCGGRVALIGICVGKVALGEVCGGKVALGNFCGLNVALGVVCGGKVTLGEVFLHKNIFFSIRNTNLSSTFFIQSFFHSSIHLFIHHRCNKT